MRVLVFESNLMWSSRLVQSLRKLGHEPVLSTDVPSESGGADAAIVNLGDGAFDPAMLVGALRALGIPVIAHAGHKEAQLMDLGRHTGADVLATNSQLTFKLDQLLAQLKGQET